MKHLSLPPVLVLCCLVAALWGLDGHQNAAADNPTFTATPASVTAIATDVAVTVAPEPAGPPAVTREQSTPIATILSSPSAVSTIESAPVATPLPEALFTPTPQPSAPGATVVPPLLTGPTPAQLREDVRLRWGHGIPETVRRWAFLIVPAARTYTLDPNLIAAVMTMESNGDPLALSPADARGLMQILHGPWDPATNVDTGARMLSGLYAEFGDWTLALAGYNAGPAAVTAYGGIPPYRETQDYVIVVSYLWDLYGRHHLTVERRKQYRMTLRDLQRFADQRKKVRKLARIAHVTPPPVVLCSPRACGQSSQQTPEVTLDPFWPKSGAPDPLQHVGPPYASP